MQNKTTNNYSSFLIVLYPKNALYNVYAINPFDMTKKKKKEIHVIVEAELRRIVIHI